MIADSDGAGWRPLPTREEPADAQNTALEVIAPDGHHIAFRSHDRQRLNVLDLSSGETRTLVADTTGLIRHAWLSDGRAILYQTRANPSSALDVRRVALDGRDSLIRRFSRFARPDPEDTRLHFINDTLAAALTRTTVALVSLRSGTVDTVFQAPYINHGTGSSPLVVSPDGKWFGFTAGARWGDTVHAHMISIDGKQHRAIAQIGCWTRIRAFHPNGHDVIALGIVDCDTPQRSEKLYLVPLNGDPMRPLTGAEDARSISGVTLSPDGNRIVFDSDRPQRKSVVQIDLPALVRK